MTQNASDSESIIRGVMTPGPGVTVTVTVMVTGRAAGARPGDPTGLHTNPMGPGQGACLTDPWPVKQTVSQAGPEAAVG